MTIEMVRSFLLWCAVINMGLLMVSFLIFVLARDWAHRLHGRWFHMSNETFDAIWYSFMGFYKVLLFVFMIVPYIALYIVG